MSVLVRRATIAGRPYDTVILGLSLELYAQLEAAQSGDVDEEVDGGTAAHKFGLAVSSTLCLLAWSPPLPASLIL